MYYTTLTSDYLPLFLLLLVFLLLFSLLHFLFCFLLFLIIIVLVLPMNTVTLHLIESVTMHYRLSYY